MYGYNKINYSGVAFDTKRLFYESFWKSANRMPVSCDKS